MWGYIGWLIKIGTWQVVPSLYVRVYHRMVGKFRKRMNCSLIICEGISPQPIFQVAHQAFPHYMWGYIEYIKSLTWETSVPSLYVRVYRVPSFLGVDEYCSLIICEDISAQSAADRRQQPFPHYMWGYIPPAGRTAKRSFVPSLYMRVYRNRQWHPSGIKKYKCSWR